MSDNKDEFDVSFGAFIKELRTRKNWTMSDLAERMTEYSGFEKYSPMTVSRTENGSRSPSLKEARALSQVFGISLERLTPYSLDNFEAKLESEVQEAEFALQKRHSELIESIQEFQTALDDVQGKLSMASQYLSLPATESLIQVSTLWNAIKSATISTIVTNTESYEEYLSRLENDIENVVEEVSGVKQSPSHNPNEITLLSPLTKQAKENR